MREFFFFFAQKDFVGVLCGKEFAIKNDLILKIFIRARY